ncbi:MAG: hypothetical protein C0418_03625 [Coriobacteriaceae bacterium]|nr:hypothetical protein [Coriobacteriaceae bacterium]
MADKTPAATRAKRMLALLHRLTPGTRMRLDDLAAEFGVGSEELVRDLETLSICGVEPYDPYALVPLIIEGGDVHAFGELPALDHAVRLTAAEARALVTALETCGSPTDDPLPAKLMHAAAEDTSPEAFGRLVRTAAGPGGSLTTYETLAAAAERGEKLTIDYWSAGREGRSTRVVQPYALGNDRGVWYLSAFCETAGAERVFRLDRIRAAEPTGDTFERPAAPVPPTPAFTSTGLPTAEVVFSAEEEVSSRDWPGATLEPQDDGTTLARIPYSGSRWLARRVAARLGRAQVLAPEALRDTVRALAREMLGG